MWVYGVKDSNVYVATNNMMCFKKIVVIVTSNKRWNTVKYLQYSGLIFTGIYFSVTRSLLAKVLHSAHNFITINIRNDVYVCKASLFQADAILCHV